jgi:hypothetical protein
MKTLTHVMAGPQMMTADLPQPGADDFFYGWQVLRLETRRYHTISATTVGG